MSRESIHYRFGDEEVPARLGWLRWVSCVLRSLDFAAVQRLQRA